ncbi:MAG: PBP1A family penicillin-binding protein [Anaerolineae bacterium]
MRRRNALIGLLLLVLLGFGGALLRFLADLPSPEDLSAYTAAPSSKITDRYGRLLYEMPPPYTGLHTPVPLEEIPLALRQATIATEDANFYRHPGVDPIAILRALWYNLRAGEVRSGGSTLTQQLVRILMFTPEERTERTLRRKLREAALALRLGRRYTKDELLAFYLNEAYYGNLAYGVEAAAQAYFGKSVRDLDLAECALLAGLPQAPAAYNPLLDLPRAKERQSVVLRLMVDAGFITPAEADLARAEPLAFAAAPFPIRAPHFVMTVRALLEQELGRERLEAGGLRIVTTLDVDLNEAARDIVRHRLSQLATCHGALDTCPPGGYNVRNAAVVALDPTTGEVLAMVGSPDYFSAAIDGAVNGALALRQPGSSIKPVTYAAAFAEGAITPATMLLDVRTAFETREGQPYVPHNYDLRFHGPVRARVALASSYNVPAVRVLDQIGVETMADLAADLGFTTLGDTERLGLTLTLGGGEVRLLEEVAAYAAFANGGRRVTPVLVLRVEDAEGHVLWTPPSGLGERVLDPRVAYLITDILRDDHARLPTFGEGSVLDLSRPAAVKTGTTTDFRDNWTVGYTPGLVTGVWVGNADNEAMRHVSGVTGAGPIWRDVMEAALQGHPAQDFPRPDGLVDVEVCALSGLRPGPACPHRVIETFIAGTEPRETCDVHRRVDGRLLLDLPPEAQTWAREQGLASPPPEEAHRDGAPLLLIRPDPGARYRLDPDLPADAQRIPVVAEADVALRRVQLQRDGEPLAEFADPPYTAHWTLTPGEHTFVAVGWDEEGNAVRSAAVTIEVEP